MNYQIQKTGDGSHTIYLPEMDERYHSYNGAIAESKHVFLEAGFNYITKQSVKVFEVGFGTGLNALLTLIETENKNKNVDYHTVELHPLDVKQIKELNYPSLLDDKYSESYIKIHECHWNKQVEINSKFSLLKIQMDITKPSIQLSINNYDVIYFDAFAPDKQPEMWALKVFQLMYGLLANGGVLVTYCAKGSIRRLMQQCGFVVERIPGPAGKREMMRGVK